MDDSWLIFIHSLVLTRDTIIEHLTKYTELVICWKERWRRQIKYGSEWLQLIFSQIYIVLVFFNIIHALHQYMYWSFMTPHAYNKLYING